MEPYRYQSWMKMRTIYRYTNIQEKMLLCGTTILLGFGSECWNVTMILLG